MSTTIRLTTKRQATFPQELCESLGLAPGDEIELVPRIENGQRIWMLQPKKKPDRPWIGALRKYAKGVTDHSMEGIRESIRKGRSASR